MNLPFTFFVAGTPRPKGSFKSWVPPGARFPVTKNDSDTVEPWQAVVALTASAAGVSLVDGPVELEMLFFFARPKGHYGTGKNAAILKASAPAIPESHALGDGDKLVRATFDALTGRAYRDDAQVSDHVARKRYAAGETVPGVRITIRRPVP